MLKDYEFVTCWRKYSNGHTSSLHDEVIKVKQGKTFIYLVPDGDRDYNECVSHFIAIMTEEQFNHKYSTIRIFP